MKNKARAFIAAITLLFILPLTVTPVSANSRSPYWEGESSSGVVSGTKDIPIEVVIEKLTFDIPTLPYTKYRSAESFLAYDSKVTAEYTFYNPTDMTITAKMLFPYGSLPEYGRFTDDGGDLAAREHDKYSITLNGKPVEKTVRHTNSHSDGLIFDTDAEIQKISDELMTIGNYGPETPVTTYTVRVSGISEELIAQSNYEKFPRKYPLLTIKLNCGYDPETESPISRVFSKNGQERHVDATYIIKSNEDVFSFIVIGEPLDENTVGELIFYEQSRTGEITTPIGGKCEISTETTTLEEYARSIHKEGSGISFVDWFNSIIVELKQDSTNLTSWIQRDGYMMRWYEYEITLAPGEYVTNTVTAPLYPYINTGSKPYEYGYTYLLSPAGDFADFGRLDIVINTKYEMDECNLGSFEKTDTGYRLTREGLPKEGDKYLDLTFTLLNDGNTPKTEPNPNPVERFFEQLGITILNVLIYAIVVVVEVVAAFFSIFRK